ncbi:hypothetical protein [Quatrionicoccus australiensis]|uniref:hypothetical protein n=1 Tax=Quatrionicoccus australiensis TaxID=138118 RepID=UPI001CF926C4|nr:hypothetical protein [Quatrionicoccus australiensis]UCV13332.1 hypothetical protein KI612_10100 [Quatrionicoccus australiensis]
MNRSRSSANGRQVQIFISDSINDYVAARVLLLSGLLQQGAILGSTSIEKACKAILAFHGNESRGHLKKSHWNAVKNFDKNLWALLRSDFLELNKKAYLLRYTDDLPVDFNIVIAQREYLAELDHTIISLIKGFGFQNEGVDQGTKLTQLLARGDSRLLADNHVLGNKPKSEFIYSLPQEIYELRYVPLFGPVEVSYSSIRPAKQASFTRPGNVFRGEGKTHHYELSHYPIPPGSNG